MTKVRFRRQGDVGIFEVDELPATAQKNQEQDANVLAYGEVTGHSHAIYEKGCSFYKDGEYAYIDTGGGAASIKHEEHAEIPLAKTGQTPILSKFLKVVVQRQYVRGEIQKVID